MPYADRMKSLTDVLIAQGHLEPTTAPTGRVLVMIDAAPPDGVVPFWAADGTPEERAAAQAIIDEWPWSDGEQHPLEAVVAAMAAGEVLLTSAPVQDAVRASLRAVVDLLNVRLDSLGQPKILDAELMPLIGAYLARGEGLPQRPVIEELADGE